MDSPVPLPAQAFHVVLLSPCVHVRPFFSLLCQCPIPEALRVTGVAFSQAEGNPLDRKLQHQDSHDEHPCDELQASVEEGEESEEEAEPSVFGRGTRDANSS